MAARARSAPQPWLEHLKPDMSQGQ
jgi:hypothetical protein